MSRLPLLIGVSGKRKFYEHDLAKDEAAAEAVRKSFDRIFEKLDDVYRDTPKILLTGAAFGTDLIAAKAALKRREKDKTGWAVVALLPFERKEFRKDFDEGPNDPAGPEWAQHYASRKADFEALMRIGDEDERSAASAPRVIVRELPKLLAVPAVKGQPEPDALTVKDIEGRSNPLRDEHYEQVGQFIAESAMIMIAVTKANEKADACQATGGTNRIVAYRRAGLDAVGAKVAAKSLVLRRTIREPIAPPVRFVWLIDLYDTSAEFGRNDYPVTPLEPFLTHATAESYAAATSVEARASREKSLTTSLLLVARLNRFNTDVATEQTIIADISPIKPEMLTRELKRVTDIISDCQIIKNRRARQSFWIMAILFVSAVFTFEIFAKFFNQEPAMLAMYLVILMLIAEVWMIARRKYWHLDSEDYRAVAEMLRVQHAWWCAGLDERADREHLQGASNDLIPVRYAGTAIIAWLLIRSGWMKPQADWSVVRGTDRTARTIALSHNPPRVWIVKKLTALADKLRGRVPDSPPDWIGDQLSYFARKAPDREDKVRITEAGSWTLFAASGFLGAVLCLLLVEGAFFHSHLGFHWFKVFSSSLDRFFVPLTGRHLSPVAWGALAGVAICARIWLRRMKRWRPLSLSFGIAAITALLLSLAVVGAAPKLITMFRLEFDEIHASEAGAIVLLVGLSAIAGAWRYLTERLNIEAEAHEYRDAHVRFDRAEHLLAVDVDEKGRPQDEERARAIVFELGCLALGENEAWLKSRRERPLTPVVG